MLTTLPRARLSALLPALLGVLLAAAAPARADDATDRQALAGEVLEQLHSGAMVSNIVPAIIGQIRANLTHNDPTLLRQFDSFAPRLADKAEAAKPALLGRLTEVYARTFTADELKDMLAYYKSPTGQRIIATQSSINHDMLTAARDWGIDLAKALSADAQAELQGTAPAPAP